MQLDGDNPFSLLSNQLCVRAGSVFSNQTAVNCAAMANYRYRIV